MKPLVTFTRRDALAILVAAPLPLALPQLLSDDGASGGPDSALAARLRHALVELRLPFPAQLDLVGLSVESTTPPLRLAAVVRMTWAPGFRQRHFSAEGATADDVIAALTEAVYHRFTEAIK